MSIISSRINPRISPVTSVTRKTSSGRTRRDAVRADVLEAVERLLRDGERYTSLGIGRISDAAGVSRSAFYLNFPDKAALLVELTAQATEELFRSSEHWIRSDTQQDVESLRDNVLHSVSIFREHAAVLAAYTEVAAYDPEVAAFWASRIEGLVRAFARRISAGQKAGRIRADQVPAVTAEFVVWGSERTISQHVASQPPHRDRAFAEGLARAMWAMIYS
jgi:AcrR family transcriptional regulator